MAAQLHMSHSSLFMGLGVLSGGPYFCSRGLFSEVVDCTGATPSGPEVDQLLNEVFSRAAQGDIDNPTNIKDHKIFLMTGTEDTVVPTKIIHSNEDFYKQLGVSQEFIKVVDDQAFSHSFPTLNFGNSCVGVPESPFIGNCQYDGAGEVLNHLHENLKPRGRSKESNYFFMSQQSFVSYSMGQEAVVYVPEICQSGQECKLHVAFHGCQQTISDIDDQFYSKTGFSDWAETNDMIILFPQARRSLFLVNPQGCWDWWGYTGRKFHTQKGPQIRAVYGMLEKLMTFGFELNRRAY